MTADEYKAAKKRLGYGHGKLQNWLDKLGIRQDAHKKYSSGDLEVQKPVQNHIHTLLELDAIKKSVLNALKMA